MNKDMDSLQNAEKALQSLQQELVEKENREKEISEKKTDDPETLNNSCSDLEISQLKAEIAVNFLFCELLIGTMFLFEYKAIFALFHELALQ